MRTFILFVVMIINCVHYVHTLDFVYHKYVNMTQYMENYCRRYTHFNCNLDSIGLSKSGRQLWVIVVDAVNETEIEIPNIKLIGNIHGNEAVGRELLLHLLEYIGENYPTDPRIKTLLEGTRVHILPSLNPDGFEIAIEGLCVGLIGRNNGENGLDLNRNFPDYFKETYDPEQPETAAMKSWMNNVTFVLSTGLHGGALVANYPFDNRKKRTLQNKDQPHATPDDDVFQYIAKTYANRHHTMHLGKPCKENGVEFENGITNGAAWYPVKGGMQDFNYVKHGCMEITLEISCCKYPYAKELPGLWKSNRDALIDYSLLAQIGVKGTIVDAITKEPIRQAQLKIVGRSFGFNSSENGEFWRILLPGNYKLEVKSPEFTTKIVNFIVFPNTNATRIFVELFKSNRDDVETSTEQSKRLTKSQDMRALFVTTKQKWTTTKQSQQVTKSTENTTKSFGVLGDIRTVNINSNNFHEMKEQTKSESNTLYKIYLFTNIYYCIIVAYVLF